MYFVSFLLQKYLHAVDGIDANLQARPQEPPEMWISSYLHYFMEII